MRRELATVNSLVGTRDPRNVAIPSTRGSPRLLVHPADLPLGWMWLDGCAPCGCDEEEIARRSQTTIAVTAAHRDSDQWLRACRHTTNGTRSARACAASSLWPVVRDRCTSFAPSACAGSLRAGGCSTGERHRPDTRRRATTPTQPTTQRWTIIGRIVWSRCRRSAATIPLSQ
jgi:hypothetical protein